MKSKIAYAIEQRIKTQNRSITSVERDGGLKRGVVWNLVNGKTQTPRTQTLEQISSALGCTVEDIYSDVVGSSTTAINNNTNSSRKMHWDSNFYTEVVRSVNSAFSEHNITPPKGDVLDIVDEVYDFCYESREIDSNLVQVLVRHELRRN